MPVLRIADELVYYAHVPKCAGSAVEEYLQRRFGAVALVDRRHHRTPEAERWSRTSPQHLDVATFDRLFPPAFFDRVFAVVRHPVRRLVSAYHFQVDVEGSVPADLPFDDWVEGLADAMTADPYVHDNHVRPMDDIVPAGAEVFRLEDGLDRLVPWFDEVEGRRRRPRTMPAVNSARAAQRVVPGPAALEVLAELYAVDFDRFGYDLQPPPRVAPSPGGEDGGLLARAGDLLAGGAGG